MRRLREPKLRAPPNHWLGLDRCHEVVTAAGALVEIDRLRQNYLVQKKLKIVPLS
jgi:hypothetical protein